MNLLRVLLCSVLGLHPSDVPPKFKIPVKIGKCGNGRRNGAFLHISFKIVVFAGLLGVRQRPPQGAEFVCVPCGANNSKSVGLITRAGSTPATGTTPNGSQTLDIAGFAGFFYCVVSLMYRSLSQPKTGHFRSIFGCFSEGHWRDVQPLQRGVYTHDRIGGCHFRGEMQVRIDVGSRRNIVLFVLPGLLFLFDRLIIRPKKRTGIRLSKNLPRRKLRREGSCEGKPSGCPFAFHNPPQRQNCNAAGKTRAPNSGLTSGAELFILFAEIRTSGVFFDILGKSCPFCVSGEI